MYKNSNIDIDKETVRQQLNHEVVVSILGFIGYTFNRRGMFKLRPEERTASASVDRFGRITDFGSGWRGDIFALLQEYHGLSFPEALEYVSTCLGGVK